MQWHPGYNNVSHKKEIEQDQCVSQFFIAVTKLPKINNLKEVSAHGCRCLSPWSLDCAVLGLW